MIQNSIIRRSSGSEITASRTDDVNQLSVSYSNLRNGLEGIDHNHNIDITWGDGNIDADPLFVDPDHGDYHLTENSPCIDAGDPNSRPDPDGTRADMGAFYFEQDVPRPVIFVEPDSLDFGVVGVGDMAADTLTVFNFGGEPLIVEDITIWEQEAFLIESGGDPFELEPGENHTIVISFFPSEELEYSDVLRISSNDPAREVVEVTLAGEGMLMVPHLAVNPAELQFGYVERGEHAERRIILRNTGNRLLNIRSLAIDPWQSPFRIVQGGEVIGIDPDSSWAVTIRFAPTVSDQFEALLLIESDDLDRELVEVTLSGSALSVDDDRLDLPTEFGVTAISPNPFNSSTSISYQLPQPGWCELTVIDVAGREVAKLTSEWKAAGRYEAVWDASRQSAGVYLLRLTAPDRSEFAKLVVVK